MIRRGARQPPAKDKDTNVPDWNLGARTRPKALTIRCDQAVVDVDPVAAPPPFAKRKSAAAAPAALGSDSRARECANVVFPGLLSKS